SNPVNSTWLSVEPVEERPLGETEVRPVVVWRHAALVTPPDARAAPVLLQLGSELVRASRSRAAGECDLAPGARRLREQLGDSFRRRFFVVDHDKLGSPHPHGAPAASSRERSIAASCVAAKAA